MHAEVFEVLLFIILVERLLLLLLLLLVEGCETRLALLRKHAPVLLTLGLPILLPLLFKVHHKV